MQTGFRADRLSLRRCALAAVLSLLGACGGSGGEDIAPAVTADGAHAYVEPTAALRPGHVAIVRLKPVADKSSDGQEDGVSRAKLHLEAQADYTLAVDADSELVQRLIVRTSDGSEIARHERGQAPSPVTLPPGTHVLEIHHARKGDPTAPAQTVFVRLASTPPRHAGASASAPARALNSVLKRPQLASDPNAEAAIRAGKNCLDCDLSNADLSGLTLSNGQDVSGSDFSGSNLAGADWFDLQNRVIAHQANFSTNAASGKATVLSGSFLVVEFVGSNFTDADLSLTKITGAILDGANLSGATVGGQANSWQWRSTRMVGVIVSMTTRFSSLTGGSPFTAGNLSSVVFPVGYAGFKGRDLRYVNFSGASFVGADLSGANLLGATLDNVNFANAKLTGVQPTTLFATSKPADVSGVDFKGFDLSAADFSQTALSATTSFVGAKLSDDTGVGIKLAGLSFPPLSTLLQGLDLSYANLNGTHLSQVNLQGTILNNAQLHAANLNFANLKGAQLRGAQLGAAPGTGEAKSTLIGAYMPNVDFTDADLRSADLTGAHVYGTALLLRTRFDSANFSGANLAGAAFSGSMTSAVFNGASLVNATFSGADLTNASFDSALLQGTDFSAAASLLGVSLSNALVATTGGSWSFTETDGTPFVYSYNATALGSIATGTGADRVTCPSGNGGPCATPASLVPLQGGPFPPKPTCVPLPPNDDNCLRPAPP